MTCPPPFPPLSDPPDPPPERPWLYQVVCLETADAHPAPHPLSPRFRNRTVACRWLGNYLAYSADNLEHDGALAQAAAFRGAAESARANGWADIGTVHYQVLPIPAW
ncbi:hypothetical protein GCM10009678_55980 [Actinomadura kijaniata]|uniref:Uncharacterized protein n=1 Tax=Actinomadura namibiensis TaxID=182080 RepID=A0A7W3LRI2_ACTNM|nr:hypothetical protein [Actinomadura namibiensis]MBA8952968.1 hypothetical protein [Actinomadura namibiensis]